jgi:hypothetical protein
MALVGWSAWHQADPFSSRLSQRMPWLAGAPNTITPSDSDGKLGLSTPKVNGTGKLLAKAGLDRHPFAPLGAAAGKHLLAALGLHAHAKPVLLASLAPVRLERTFRHEK